MPADEPDPRARVVVLLSGSGSLCAALLAATDDPAYPATVVAVGSDRPAEGLEHPCTSTPTAPPGTGRSPPPSPSTSPTSWCPPAF